MEVIIVRHGQTPGNAERRYVGSVEDQPLSEKGREQARAARVDEAVSRVYTSPMRRARETAELMFPSAELIAWDGLQEMNFGVFTGRSADEMEDDADYRAWVESGCTSRCPGGESKDECSERICHAFLSLLANCAARGEERVWLVAHGGTLMSVLDRFADDERSYWEWLCGNCAGYRMEVLLVEGGLQLLNVEPWPE